MVSRCVSFLSDLVDHLDGYYEDKDCDLIPLIECAIEVTD
jgi:hypothetical protein